MQVTIEYVEKTQQIEFFTQYNSDGTPSITFTLFEPSYYEVVE